jgi:endonuclease III related protein
MNQKYDHRLTTIYEMLFRAFGPRRWWPAETPEEVIFGAILTQNTAWKNVELSLKTLKQARKMSFRSVAVMPQAELAALVRSSGFFNQKAGTLKAFAEYFGRRYRFSLPRMKEVDLWTLRRELLEIPRIGMETADSILLYALEKPVFVIDTYTKRIFSRHGFMEMENSYAEFQNLFTTNLPRDVPMYNEYHALIVRAGHLFCKPTPQCPECPLSGLTVENRDFQSGACRRNHRSKNDAPDFL